MRWKYYLRGAGLGIIVAVLLMMAAFKLDGGMTDEEIMERAEELGMVMPESGSLPDRSEEDENEADGVDGVDGVDGADGAADENTAGEDASGGDGSVTVNQENADDTGDAAQQEEQKAAEEAEKKAQAEVEAAEAAVPRETSEAVTFVIAPGEYSDVVSANLAAAGLIDNAEAYNEWLMDTGYDNFLQPGTYVIPADSTDEEIAQILMTKPEEGGTG